MRCELEKINWLVPLSFKKEGLKNFHRVFVLQTKFVFVRDMVVVLFTLSSRFAFDQGNCLLPFLPIYISALLLSFIWNLCWNFASGRQLDANAAAACSTDWPGYLEPVRSPSDVKGPYYERDTLHQK